MPSASTVFVDTNVLAYAASGLPADAAKTARARELLKQEAVSISSLISSVARVLCDRHSSAQACDDTGGSQSLVREVLELSSRITRR